ncbi:GNAT family N-acetyltransferase [Roseibacterium sp. SDUM158017]|uniref:GNAT family N-acetyltransferase n=1 Tax=Roseicyclus salinarum TaxID=3036773 RepID=UPI002415788D|nr:GNAT family N-acetyltransferase [Roseibacterium sp. SDUM158017]MDG4650384.1 GNAT family N-acetyltransferase [Roseibacterium sp. SDUM158017]
MTCHSSLSPAHLDADLLTEGEAIERLALRSLHEAATPDQRRDLRLDWHETAGSVASVAGALPASAIVVNRAFLCEGAEVSAAAEPYRRASVARFFLHVPKDGGTAVPTDFTEARPWQKFLRMRGAPLPDAPAIDIARVAPGPTAEAVARIVCAAFDLGPVAEGWIARLCLDARWQIFVARIDGVVAGTGALFVSGGIGWCDWGATAPAFRGRGIQRALLRHRLATADALGIPRVHTCTGAPAPGDPQHSYRNILRCGFTETVLRRNLKPDCQ